MSAVSGHKSGSARQDCCCRAEGPPALKTEFCTLSMPADGNDTKHHLVLGGAKVERVFDAIVPGQCQSRCRPRSSGIGVRPGWHRARDRQGTRICRDDRSGHSRVFPAAFELALELIANHLLIVTAASRSGSPGKKRRGSCRYPAGRDDRTSLLRHVEAVARMGLIQTTGIGPNGQARGVIRRMVSCGTTSRRSRVGSV